MTEPMNPAQIAAMVADSEAGTPGKWVVGFREDGSSYLSIGGLEPGQAHSQGDIFFHTDYPRDIANARRIARVPELEAMVITQAAEIARLTAERDAAQKTTETYRIANRNNLDRADAADAKVAVLTAALRWSHDTLTEINPSNYGHDDVCNLNDRSTEVILALQAALGEVL